MNSDVQVALTLTQVDAIVRALEYCGANENDLRRAVGVFNDLEVANTAKSARRHLIATVGKETRRSEMQPLLRDLEKKDDAYAGLRAAYRKLWRTTWR